jgi:hypothetical protein
METVGNVDKLVKTSEKVAKNTVIRNEKGQVIKGTPNPNGRPKGAVSFTTKWYAMIDKIAKMENVTRDDLDMDLLKMAFDKAKKGDFKFYQDIHDRIYGKPAQTVDLTNNGKQFEPENHLKVIANQAIIGLIENNGKEIDS